MAKADIEGIIAVARAAGEHLGKLLVAATPDIAKVCA